MAGVVGTEPERFPAPHPINTQDGKFAVREDKGEPLAGFSRDNLRTWEFVVVADPDEYGIGFSESDIVRLEGGRIVAIYGNNQNSPWFFRTYSDDDGRSWAPMKQIEMRGDSPAMVKLSDGTLMAAYRNLPEDRKIGIGLAVSTDGGESWDVLGNIRDQGGWDMGYPDLIKLCDGNFLCTYYTAAEEKMISAAEVKHLTETGPARRATLMRPSAYEELNGEIRGTFITDLTAAAGAAGGGARADEREAKVEL